MTGAPQIEETRRVEITAVLPRSPGWWLGRVLLVCSMGLAALGVFGIGAIFGRPLLSLFGFLCMAGWIFPAVRLFRTGRERWTFAGGVLEIERLDRSEFPRRVALSRIRTLEVATGSRLELALPDPDRGVPEFLRIESRRLHTEDVLDSIEAMLEALPEPHLFSVLQRDQLHASRLWSIHDELPATPLASEARVRSQVSRFTATIDGAFLALMHRPFLALRDPADGMTLLVRRQVVYRTDGLALGRAVRVPADPYRPGCVELECSGGEALVVDEVREELRFEGRRLGMVSTIPRVGVVFEASEPLPRSWLLLALAAWMAVPREVHIDAPARRA